jgi:type III pantothenate kinase
VSTVRGTTVDELAAQHDAILTLRGGSLTEVDHVVVASVVPQLTAAYQRLAERYLGRAAVVVGPGVRTGMPLLIDNPHELGADRLVNAVAAYRRYGGPCVVVDFGTATTLDVVSAAGEYMGGVIAPGIETSLDALTSRAARLMKVDLLPPPRCIGRSTVESMQSGLVIGAAAMVDGLVARIEGELGVPPVVVATGGLAPLVTPLSAEIELHDPLLTLQGLRTVHELNTQAPPASRPRGGRR